MSYFKRRAGRGVDVDDGDEEDNEGDDDDENNENDNGARDLNHTRRDGRAQPERGCAKLKSFLLEHVGCR